MRKQIEAPVIKDKRYFVNDYHVLQEFYLIGRHPNFPHSKVIAINSPWRNEKRVFDIDVWENLPTDKKVALKELLVLLREDIEVAEDLLNQ